MTRKLYYLATAVVMLCMTLSCGEKEPQGGPSEPQQDPVTKRMSNHPRLLMDEAEWTTLQNQVKEGSNSPLVQMHKNSLSLADSFADAYAAAYDYTPVDGNCHLPHCILVNLAYAYRMTGEQKYLTAATTVLTRMSSLSTWNSTVKFLNTAEIACGVSLAYDWLYNDLEESLRDKTAKAIKALCIDRAMNSGDYDWKKTNNWAQLCNGALIVSAIALWETDKNYMRTVLNKAVECNKPAVAAMYSPDGNYVEGYAYWDYGSIFQMLLEGALDGCYGNDYGICKTAGFDKTGEWMVHMIGTTGENFNYSDSPSSTGPLAAQWYFAAKFKDPSILFLELKKMGPGYLLSMDSGRFLPEAIYFASKIKASDIKAPTKKVWSGKGDQPMVLVHTDWTLSETDKFLGVKGGQASNPHSHYDAGSFVYDAFGVRWAADPFITKVPEDGVSGKGTTNSYNNQYHNTLTFNGVLHSTGMATLEEVYDSADKKGGLFDLSKVFTSASKVTRSVFIEKDKDLVVVDDITSTGAVSTVRFAFITATTPALTPDGWLLTASNGRKMLLSASTSTGAAITYDSLPTGKIEVHDQDISAWNNIGFTVKNPGTTVITTRLTPVE